MCKKHWIFDVLVCF